ALLEVLQQAGVSQIEHRTQGFLVIVEAHRQRPAIGVAIPGNFVEDRIKHIYGHEAYAMLDQPPGQETRLTKSVPPVACPRIIYFAGNVESLFGFLGENEAESLVVGIIARPAVLRSVEGTVGLVHSV